MGGRDKFGEAHRVRLIGCFTCYYLAPGATLTVTDELFFASRGTKHRTIQVWEAEALLVDGMTPFEKWVSFNLRSDPDLLVPSQSEMGQELAEFKRVNDLNYYNHPKKWPEQKVKFMKGDRIVKHQVPVKDVPD